jgi:hypothetical protein
MVLLVLVNTWPPSEEHRRSILHEFGHGLGLHREHQSPAVRKSNLFRLNESAKRNILRRIKENEKLWNYTNFDPASIMT